MDLAPNVIEFSNSATSLIFEADIKKHLFLFAPRSAADFETHLAALNQAAETFQDRVMSVYLDTDIADNLQILENLRLKKEDAPIVRLVDLEGRMQLWAMTPPYTASSYCEFITAWEAGEIAPQGFARMADHILHYNPLVIEFTDESADRIFGGDIKQHLILFSSKSAENFKTHFAALREAAETIEDRILSVYIDTDYEENYRVFEFLCVNKENAPTVRLIDFERNILKWMMEPPYTASRYREFVAAWEAGEIAPFFQSQEIPETQDGPVYELVGKSFDAVKRDSGKNMFVHFYAPWAGQCKQVAPVWDRLGVLFAGSEDILIAKMDASLNEVSGVSIPTFPIFRYFSTSGEVIDYTGDRDLESFAHFLKTGEILNRMDNEPIPEE